MSREATAGHDARYLPFVDGLRAVAILSVVACHIGIPGLGGGYVGVDVFFVISGFLIINQI
ncbi:MAG: acyltransferase, partial [Rhizobiales bacterium]|nr:acyltransferase [Hyphomicrobiales bacterium]